MCMGGGGNRGTIVQPDYGAYEQQFQLQKDAIDAQMSNGTMLLQQELQSSLQLQNNARAEIAEAKVAKADSQRALQEQATRLATLLGPPPPEETAQAPVVGARERGLSDRKGKKSLRIGKTATSSAQGIGLNIT